jgi:hypothetical protein
MRGRLTPIASGLPDCPTATPSGGRPFAHIDRGRLVALARAMPDCQSAVLACLLWQACLQERLALGPLAGRFVARLSGRQLAEMTGRPLRTVRHALRRLTQQGAIHREDSGPGIKAVYAPALPPGQGSSPPG